MQPVVVLITGCSTGIGRATAVVLTEAGYEVVATARRAGQLEGIGAGMTLSLDVVEPSSIEAVVQTVIARYGQIDVLVNNAGYGIRGAVEELDIAAVDRMFDVNVNGMIRMVQAVVPYMRAQRSGRIVNVGSIGGKLAAPGNGAYSATKHAVEAINDAMRWELQAFGIQVALIEPGSIRTSFTQTVTSSSSSMLHRQDSPYAELYANWAAATARIRAHESAPEVVAHVILTALRARRPRIRYKVAVPLATRIIASLPDVGKDLAMRRRYRLGPRTREGVFQRRT